MNTPTYFDIQELISIARGELAIAQAGDIEDVINVCAILLDLIEKLNEKDAPK